MAFALTSLACVVVGVLLGLAVGHHLGYDLAWGELVMETEWDWVQRGRPGGEAGKVWIVRFREEKEA